jgi:hypothetical protein
MITEIERHLWSEGGCSNPRFRTDEFEFRIKMIFEIDFSYHFDPRIQTTLSHFDMGKKEMNSNIIRWTPISTTL